MHLNKQKFIHKEKTSTLFFFNFPTLSLTSYSQALTSKDTLDEIKLVQNKISKKRLKKSFRFSFSKGLKSFFLVNHFRIKRDGFKNFKNLLLTSNTLFKAQKLHRFLILKRVKGGFKSSSLGLINFMPKSLYIFIPKGLSKVKNKHFLLKIKLLKRKKKFSSKSTIKVNIISSCKKK